MSKMFRQMRFAGTLVVDAPLEPLKTAFSIKILKTRQVSVTMMSLVNADGTKMQDLECLKHAAMHV